MRFSKVSDREYFHDLCVSIGYKANKSKAKMCNGMCLYAQLVQTKNT